ncbi:alkylphosphonate utilization protein (plasmid) [Aminobacter sp. NyZ550]|uniref:alkylphosphonate utilization protein n=1 Tax=unclassified Aminobacter TaxID=2644704 RepID=UPI0021D57458|nr:alkylphosphonate utilization protein [Aminobacter sp. NyZ550]WAX98693.1 alkylphosphonate utilization protein [Aminobacter sp. NyZ550]
MGGSVDETDLLGDKVKLAQVNPGHARLAKAETDAALGVKIPKRIAEVNEHHGNLLADGDAVVLIKDLKVKGAGQTLKQGTVIRSIRLTDNPQEIDCRHDAIKGLVLRTEFVRKR